MYRKRITEIILGGLFAACSANAASLTGGKLNVLFIASDDLNDWIGCLGGHPDAKTPNIDALARRGVLFSNAHCAAPCCGPSRAALLTGVAPWESGVYWNDSKLRNSPVLHDVKTLPQQFWADGYRVTGSGKIFHDLDHEAASWQDYWPSLTQARIWPLMPPKEKRPLNGVVHDLQFDWGAIDRPVQEMSDWRTADWIIKQLKTPDRDPFFLACGFFKPHLPWYVPQEYLDRFPLDQIHMPAYKADDLDDLPPIALKTTYWMEAHRKMLDAGGEDNWRRGVQAMLASISFVDDCVGRVIDALDHSPYADNTIVVLWGDHGQHCGEKDHWSKFTGWERTTHTPLMMVVPGLTKSGGVCKRPVNLLDIYPTLTEICNLHPQHELSGTSLVPLLKNPQAERKGPSITTLGPKRYSLRTERWRYISYEDGSEELYDRDADPNEWKNLADNPEYAGIKATLKKQVPVNVAAPVPDRVEPEEWKKDRLRQLEEWKKNTEK
jgi:arylsulfatase A-like enzyme